MEGLKDKAAIGLSVTSTAVAIGGVVWAKNKFGDIEDKIEALDTKIANAHLMFTGNGQIPPYPRIVEAVSNHKTVIDEVRKNMDQEMANIKEGQKEINERLDSLEERINSLVAGLTKTLPDLEEAMEAEKKIKKKKPKKVQIKTNGKTKKEEKDVIMG